MPSKINITGTTGKTYDLDKLQSNNGRASSEEELLVQIWNWNPNLKEPYNSPNPPDLKIGQIWMSKLVKEGSAEYAALKKKVGGD